MFNPAVYLYENLTRTLVIVMHALLSLSASSDVASQIDSEKQAFTQIPQTELSVL